MKYFITGATGFVGGRVTQMLLDAGHTLTAVVRTPEKAKALAARGVTLHQGDVTEKESMRAAMTGTDGVFHIAGWYKIGHYDKREGEAVNIQGTRNVLELMRELGIRKGVYTSTLATFSNTHGEIMDERYHFTGQHVSLYDRTKAAAHDIAEAFMAQGLPLVIVLPGLIYGPGDTSVVHDLMRAYLQRKLPAIPQQTAYCWGHIDDMAHAHILAMEKGRAGEAYIIGGPQHTLIDALALAERYTGIPAPKLHLAPWMLQTFSALMSVVERIVPVPQDYTSEYLRVSAGVTYLGNNGKAKLELGFVPRPLQAGLPFVLALEMAALGMPVPQPRA